MPFIAQQRIDMFTEILLVAGWTTDRTGGWLAPEKMRTEVAQQYGAGHLHIWDAAHVQLRFDHFVVHHAAMSAVPA